MPKLVEIDSWLVLKPFDQDGPTSSPVMTPTSQSYVILGDYSQSPGGSGD